ncbi:MAG: response regulator [Steroidobacteraceae bacterium]
MTMASHIVFVVDDDFRVREAVLELLASAGFNAIAFESGAEYLAFEQPELPSCLILDVELNDMNGIDLQRQIADDCHPPIVFITGHGDIPSTVRAMKAGAVDFLTKPFSQQQLLKAVETSFEQDRKARSERAELKQLRQRLASLTPREREVLPLVISGLLNKQAAAQLGISEITLQIHRSKVMQKMAAQSLAELVRMATKLEIPLTAGRHS